MAAQMQARRAQRLCYNCDEKYITRHRCKPQQFLLLQIDNPNETYHNIETLDMPNKKWWTSTCHRGRALQGNQSPKTLQFQGTIYGHIVTFTQCHATKDNTISTTTNFPTPKFPVMVGNGERIYCTGLCKETIINLQYQLFNILFYLLPIQGADIVLGIKWLSTLGLVTSDFSVSSMTFNHDHKTITLTGQQSNQPTLASLAYELELPPSSQIHNVFHVSLLKPFYGTPPTRE
ncbi:hypothetical protein Lal_00028340 [Lupinus albus]|nr:hypothetical protein Lal_00028340 [Lupinus albus]